MSTSKTETLEVRPVPTLELAPEFKKFDKPLGFELHHVNIIVVGLLAHGSAAYHVYSMLAGYVAKSSLFTAWAIGIATGFGMTIGSHRLWSHRTFKANIPLQIILMLLQTSSGQWPIFKWCRDHRVHHKYTDTDADPHNSKRGLWFSHVGWLFERRHPETEKKFDVIDISDLAADPVVKFQSKHYWELLLLTAFAVPMTIGHWLHPEMTFVQLFAWNQFRFSGMLHVTFLVNSAAHMWGNKPYDKHISPTENKWVALLANGEGWHNYHHAFPWDYKAAELGYKYNLSTMVIDFFARVGWATDLKTVSHKMLSDRINRTG